MPSLDAARDRPKIGSKVLGVIVARGGSKGVPGKNLIDLCGRPALAWTIEAGLKSMAIGRLILSTDSPEMADIARQMGCEVPFMRPTYLAQDDTPINKVILHALDMCGDGFDYVLKLQASSPLRLPEDIDETAAKCFATGAPACISVVQSSKSVFWAMRMKADGTLDPLHGADYQRMRRQDLPSIYIPNGAVYIAEIPWYRQVRTWVWEGTVGYEMPAERSLDIDGEFEVALIRALLQDRMARERRS